MKKQLIPILFAVAIICLIACQKSISDFDVTGTGSPDNNTAHTVANISGAYSLKGLTWNFSGTTINVYDSLDACEKDDLFKFNTDMTLVRTDEGAVCSPPGNDVEPWLLRNDSIFLGTSTNGAKIKSFDGTTLVLTGVPASDPGVLATTTFVKR